MKKIQYFYFGLFLTSFIFIFIDWSLGGFDLLEFQPQHFYFQ